MNLIYLIRLNGWGLIGAAYFCLLIYVEFADDNLRVGLADSFSA
ncbi:MAG: hypothetical protein ACRC1Z_08470 [Waterburya sp.]